MKNEEQQKLWLDLNKMTKKLVLLRYSLDHGSQLATHINIAFQELSEAKELLKKQIEP